MMTDRHEAVSVRDIGLDNATDADGLAVARPSGFVGRTLSRVISGCFTVQDDTLYQLLALTAEKENLYLEPSALAGMPGPFRLLSTPEGKAYLRKQRLEHHMDYGTHVVWATGGGLVPGAEMEADLARGRKVLETSW